MKANKEFSGVVPLNLQPASSFSTEPETPEAFHYPIDDRSHGVIMGATVPVHRILGSHETGLGTNYQTEHVVLGGEHHAYVHAGRMSEENDAAEHLQYPPSSGTKADGNDAAAHHQFQGAVRSPGLDGRPITLGGDNAAKVDDNDAATHRQFQGAARYAIDVQRRATGTQPLMTHDDAITLHQTVDHLSPPDLRRAMSHPRGVVTGLRQQAMAATETPGQAARRQLATDPNAVTMKPHEFWGGAASAYLRPPRASKFEFAGSMPDPISDNGEAYSGDPYGIRADETKKGLTIFNRMIGKGAANIPPVARKSIGNWDRSHYDAAAHAIGVPLSTNRQTVVHEMGHALEAQNPHILAASNALLNRRTFGAPQTDMADIGIPGEMTRADHFVHPYVGKDYGGAATEIASMGLEHMFTRPAQFAQEDPEHFDYIHSIMHGRVDAQGQTWKP